MPLLINGFCTKVMRVFSGSAAPTNSIRKSRGSGAPQKGRLFRATTRKEASDCGATKEISGSIVNCSSAAGSIALTPIATGRFPSFRTNACTSAFDPRSICLGLAFRDASYRGRTSIVTGSEIKLSGSVRAPIVRDKLPAGVEIGRFISISNR